MTRSENYIEMASRRCQTAVRLSALYYRRRDKSRALTRPILERGKERMTEYDNKSLLLAIEAAKQQGRKEVVEWISQQHLFVGMPTVHKDWQEKLKDWGIDKTVK